MSKKLFIIAAICMTVVACNLQNLAGEVGNVKQVGSDDEKMNAAIEQAQESLPIFIDELNSPSSDQMIFSIKAKFPLENENSAEHLWVGDVVYGKNQFVGILGNEPVYVKGYHLGDEVVIEKENVSDWMIIDGSKLFGGFTVHVLAESMSETDLADFESSYGIALSEEPLLP